MPNVEDTIKGEDTQKWFQKLTFSLGWPRVILQKWGDNTTHNNAKFKLQQGEISRGLSADSQLVLAGFELQFCHLSNLWSSQVT